MSLTTRVLAGLISGLGLGLVVSASGQPTLLRIVDTLEPLGELWVNGIRMTVVPLVVALLISGIGSGSARSAGRLGGKALALFVAFAVGAGLIAALAAPPLLSAVSFDQSALSAIADTAGGQVELPTLRDWVVGLIPTNPVRAAADEAMLPLLVFATILAVAVTRLEAASRDVLVTFFSAMADAMLVIVRWILLVAPFGVFFLVLALTTRAGASLVGALGIYVLLASVLAAVALLALYPVTALATGVPVGRFARACAPVQAVAFSTRSSLASLPAMLEAADDDLALPPQVSGLVLPVAVALFKYASPTVRITGTLFVAQLYGIDLGPAALGAIVGSVVALSFYSPGVPSGGLFLLTPIYVSLGLPVEGVGLLIALDLIPDMFITTANVTADLSVATILTRSRRGVLDLSGASGEPVVDVIAGAEDPVNQEKPT